MRPLLLPFFAIALVLFLVSIEAHALEPTASKPPTISVEEALALLKKGNQRFVSNSLEHPHQTANRRAELATNQHPFAIILGCADSRTSPELIFDQGLGDIFELRIAGNVLNEEILGSIEYAVTHLGTRLIVVLGHQRCGAVTAARETIAAKTKAPGHIQSLVTAIAPAVQATGEGNADVTAKVHVANVTQALRDSGPILKEMVAKNTIKVVGAYYNLDTGVVEFFPDPSEAKK